MISHHAGASPNETDARSVPSKEMSPDLTDERFISLLTYRRSGEAVATPVWFAKDGGDLLVGTFSGSGKAKRLAHTRKVQVAPCNFRGLVKSDYLDAVATLAPPEDAETIGASLEAKYGWQWQMFGRKIDVFIRISLPA